MIPDHLIDRAWHAYVRSSNQQAIRNEMAYPDLRGPMPPPPDPRLSMRAALEVVAAEIWDEGWSQGMAYVTGMERGIDDDELDHTITNPYRASEDA